MKASKWIKPGTNETRVYFSVQQGVKVFAVKSDNDRFDVRFAPCDFHFNKDSILNIIDIELEELNNGERVILWSDLIKLVK